MSPGQVLCGRYVVGDIIGRGGVADVHVGRDIRSGRWVAIKRLRENLAEDPAFRHSLQREARTMGRLRHRGVVALHDAGYDLGKASSARRAVPFIVMEHVAGWSLRELLGMGGLTLAKSIQYQDGVLSALAAVHRAGIVHRDIKPANVMATSRGVVKLVDFGIARPGDDPAATAPDLRAFLGTPRYLSPEQVRGGTTDARSDLYSAGCLLFEMLHGLPPFTGDDPVSLAYQHVHEQPPRLDTGIPALDSVVATALAKLPDDRFQSARAFRGALRTATGHLAPAATATARRRAPTVPVPRSPARAGAMAHRAR